MPFELLANFTYNVVLISILLIDRVKKMMTQKMTMIKRKMMMTKTVTMKATDLSSSRYQLMLAFLSLVTWCKEVSSGCLSKETGEVGCLTHMVAFIFSSLCVSTMQQAMVLTFSSAYLRPFFLRSLRLIL